MGSRGNEFQNSRVTTSQNAQLEWCQDSQKLDLFFYFQLILLSNIFKILKSRIIFSVITEQFIILSEIYKNISFQIEFFISPGA